MFAENRIHIAGDLQTAAEDECLQAGVARASRLGDEHRVEETAQLSVEQLGILAPKHLGDEAASILQDFGCYFEGLLSAKFGER